MQSASYELAPEVQAVVRAALHQVLVAKPEKPVTFLAQRLKWMNDERLAKELEEDVQTR